MYIDSEKSIQCETCGNWRREFWMDDGKTFCVSCLARELVVQSSKIESMETEIKQLKAKKGRSPYERGYFDED